MPNFNIIKINIDLSEGLSDKFIKRYKINNIKIIKNINAGSDNYTFNMPYEYFEVAISQLYGLKWEATYKNGTYHIYE